METLKNQLRTQVKTVAGRIAPGTMAAVRRVRGLDREVAQLRQEVSQLRASNRELRARVNDLQAGLQESRKLNQRIAELTDVVAEVIVPAADRDDERLHKALVDYEQASF